MTALVYIACCMGISFIVGLVMGHRIGYAMALERASEAYRAMAAEYTAQLRDLSRKEVPNGGA